MKFRSILIWTSVMILVLALVGLAYLGTFTRFHADDFCMAADASGLGLTGMLVKWYSTWTGRFSFILGTGVFGLGGPGLAGWLPALAIASWLLALSWTILPLARRLRWPRPALTSVSAAGLGLLVLFSATPNLFQSLFWQDGMVNYSLPLIGLTFNLGLILNAWLGRSNRLAAAAAGLLAFVCGGFTEAFSAMQVTLFGMALIGGVGFRKAEGRRRLLILLGAALAGSLLAMGLVLASPGNQVRQAAVGQAPGLVRLIIFSSRNAIYIIGKFILQTPFWALVAAGAAFLAGWILSPAASSPRIHLSLAALWRQPWLRGFWMTLAAVFILVTAACAPVVYALNAYPDDRTIIVPLFVVVVGGMAASTALAYGLRQAGLLPNLAERPALARALQAGLLVIILSTGLVSLFHVGGQVSGYQAYAAAWDQRAAVLQQAAGAGVPSVTAVGLNARFGVADLNADPNNWVNRCVASYYHLSSVSGR